jgi:histidine triad (HIT) family protein
MEKDCIFCRIVAGEIPSFKVHEDQDFLGFMDIKPINPGQTLLIPKKHYRWVDDVPNFGEYFEAAKKVGLATRKALKPITVCYVTLGFEVPHAHIRIIPRYENDGHEDGLNFKLYKPITPEELAEIAAKIKVSI